MSYGPCCRRSYHAGRLRGYGAGLRKGRREARDWLLRAFIRGRWAGVPFEALSAVLGKSEATLYRWARRDDVRVELPIECDRHTRAGDL